MNQSALSNKLKQLRMHNNLPNSVLADMIGVSTTHIHYLEKNKRGISDDLLHKYADVFKVSFEELKELQYSSEVVNDKSVEIEKESDGIDELVSLFLSVEEPLQKRVLSDFREYLQKMFIELLTPYCLNDLKKVLTNIRSTWYQLDTDEILPDEQIIGNIKFPDQEVFFNLKVQAESLTLEILYEDSRRIETFTNWLTPPDCHITLYSKIAHLEDKQKVKTFHWFSPKLGETQQLEYLKRKYNDLTQLTVENYKLHLLIKLQNQPLAELS